MAPRLLAFVAVASMMLLLHDLVPHEGVHDALAQATGHDPSRWHAPSHGHEHGDAPPAWIQAAGYQVGFDHTTGFHGNTSAAENTAKHTSMKGMHATFKDKVGGTQEVYARVHIASNQMERSARYHSYEFFLKDSTGAVSHWQGWYNSGDPVASRRSRALNDNGQRPLVLVTDLAALQMGRNCEQWYGFTSGWGPDIGWTICNSTTMYFPEENQYPEYWVVLCQYGYSSPACLGIDREIELGLHLGDSAVAPNRGGAPKGATFWATQFGEIVSGQDSARCSQKTNKFGFDYPNICLSQFIAPTARSIENRSTVPNANRFRKQYDATGVVVPN